VLFDYSLHAPPGLLSSSLTEKTRAFVSAQVYSMLSAVRITPQTTLASATGNVQTHTAENFNGMKNTTIKQLLLIVLFQWEKILISELNKIHNYIANMASLKSITK
jgi:hypothetical protein